MRYKTDGTGRDSYAAAGDGGFTNPSKAVAIDPRITFKNSLRGYGQVDDYAARRQKRLAMKSQHRNYNSMFNGDESSTMALLAQAASASKNAYHQLSMYEPKNSIGADSNLRAINDLNKRKRRHQHSMNNKLDPLLCIASNYESKLSRAANERGQHSGSFYP